MKITICRRSHFNAAHKLYNKSWSKEKNLEVFGKCSYENYHGISGRYCGRFIRFTIQLRL